MLKEPLIAALAHPESTLDEEAPPVQPTPVDPRTVCLSCGYSLAGLSPAGVCPECGLPVARSLGDGSLANSSPEYLKKLHIGAVLLISYLAACLIFAVTMFILSVIRISDLTLIGTLIWIVPLTLDLVGWWMFSEPDPGLRVFSGEKPRRIVRATVVAMFLLSVLNWGLTLTFPAYAAGVAQGFPHRIMAGLWPMLANVITLGLLAAFVTRFYAAMLYVRCLAPRLPNRRVYKYSRLFMWLFPLLMTVGVVVLGIGLLVAIILYYTIFDLMRMDLKRIRTAAASVHGTP